MPTWLLAPLVGALGDRLRIGPGQAAPLLQVVEVLPVTEPLIHRPAGTLLEHAVQVLLGQLQVPPADADAGRDVVEEVGDDLAEVVLDVGAAQT